jgi:hypothetical protein
MPRAFVFVNSGNRSGNSIVSGQQIVSGQNMSKSVVIFGKSLRQLHQSSPQSINALV